MAVALAAVVGASAGVYVGRDGGGAATPTTIRLTGAAVRLPVGTPMLGGDVDGDGRPDLVLTARRPGGEPAAVVLRGQAGDRFGAPKVWGDLTHAAARGSISAGMGDVDGDGRADLLVFEQVGDDFEIWVRRSTGTSFGAPVRWADVPGWQLSRAKIMVDDFDGDGRADVAEVGRPPSGGIDVQVLASTGSRFEAPKRWYAGPGDWERLNRGDGAYDGDRRPDVVLADASGRLTLLRNTGSSFTAQDGGTLGIAPDGLPKAFNAGTDGGRTQLGLLVTSSDVVRLGVTHWTTNGFAAPSWTDRDSWVEGRTLPRVVGRRVAVLLAGADGSQVRVYRVRHGRFVRVGPVMRVPSLRQGSSS